MSDDVTNCSSIDYSFKDLAAIDDAGKIKILTSWDMQAIYQRKHCTFYQLKDLDIDQLNDFIIKYKEFVLFDEPQNYSTEEMQETIQYMIDEAVLDSLNLNFGLIKLIRNWNENVNNQA